jgi:hypothetical protein
MSAEGASEGEPMGGETGRERVTTQREGRTERADSAESWNRANSRRKNPFQISFKFWIWQKFGKLYRGILKEFGHGDSS